MSHYIFVLNCGSSSLKFSVINPENGEEPLKGLAERLGVGGVGNITIKTAAGGKTEQQLDPGTHQEALHVIVAALKKEGLMDKIKAVGHRIVHGGEYFAESVLVDDDVRNKIVDCIRLAPLHNPAHVTGIDAAREAFPNLKQVVVFDTAFHQHMPQRAFHHSLRRRMAVMGVQYICRQGARIDTDTDGDILFLYSINDCRHLFIRAYIARIDAQGVNTAGYGLKCQFIVEVYVRYKRHGRSTYHPFQPLGCSHIGHGKTDNFRSVSDQALNVRNGFSS